MLASPPVLQRRREACVEPPRNPAPSGAEIQSRGCHMVAMQISSGARDRFCYPKQLI